MLTVFAKVGLVKQIDLADYTKFWDDYDERWHDARETITDQSSANQLRLIEEWYGYKIILDDLGSRAYIILTEQEATMFLLKWT